MTKTTSKWQFGGFRFLVHTASSDCLGGKTFGTMAKALDWAQWLASFEGQNVVIVDQKTKAGNVVRPA